MLLPPSRSSPPAASGGHGEAPATGLGLHHASSQRYSARAITSWGVHFVEPFAVRPHLGDHRGELLRVEALHYLVLERLQVDVRNVAPRVLRVRVDVDPAGQYWRRQRPVLGVEDVQPRAVELGAV